MVKCTGTTKRGRPCRAKPLVGTERCIAHSDKELQESRGFGGSQPNAGRPKVPTPTELLLEKRREFVDRNVDQMFTVLEEGLRAERALVVGNGPTAHVESVPDQTERRHTVEAIFDRVEGKATQRTEHQQDGPLVNLNILTDPELRGLAADLRRRVAASRSIESSGLDAGDGAEVDTPGPS